jgi:hypothetical protein
MPRSPGDFTLVKPPEYAELDGALLVLGDLLEYLGDLLGPDHPQVIAKRGLEAAQ